MKRQAAIQRMRDHLAKTVVAHPHPEKVHAAQRIHLAHRVLAARAIGGGHRPTSAGAASAVRRATIDRLRGAHPGEGSSSS